MGEKNNLGIELFKNIEITSTEWEDVKRMRKELPDGWKVLKKILVNEIQKNAEEVCDIYADIKLRERGIFMIEAFEILIEFLEKVEKK